MGRLVSVRGIAAGAWLALCSACASAPPSAGDAGNAAPLALTFLYEKPASAQFQELSETLRASGILEAWTRYVNRTLKVSGSSVEASLTECGVANSRYDADKRRIILCYEDADRRFRALRQSAYADENQLLVAWIGSMLHQLYHELGHALLASDSLPILEERYVADQFAVIALLGHPEGWHLVLGAADYLRASAATVADGADTVHRNWPRSQRYDNALCLTYGSDPEKHRALIAPEYLTLQRAERCRAEYYRALYGSQRLLNAANVGEAVALVHSELTESLVSTYLEWIAAETGMTEPPAPPIRFVSSEELKSRFGGFHSAVALYEPGTATIYLPERWNRVLMYDRAMLLHELVHHVQAFNRVPVPCAAQLERQAYAVTLKWLAEQGVADPYAVLDVNDLTVALLSLCFERE